MNRRAEASLARSNGAVAFRAGRPMKESNPYSRGRRVHKEFEAGWKAAEAEAADVAKSERSLMSDGALAGCVVDCDGAGGDRGI